MTGRKTSKRAVIARAISSWQSSFLATFILCLDNIEDSYDKVDYEINYYSKAKTIKFLHCYNSIFLFSIFVLQYL